MQEIKCQKCGAECAAGTSFCRQCGAPIETPSQQLASEQPTVLLEESTSVATQRFEPRTTGPERGRLPQSAAEESTPSPPEKSASRQAVLIGSVVIVIVGLICAATLIGLRSHSEAKSNLLYPGAKTVVDIAGTDGSRALQLETSDSFKSVEEWYQKNLKPHKTMRLTSTNVVMKNDKTTATIAGEANKTNILIKVNP